MAYSFDGATQYMEEVTSDFAAMPFTIACAFCGVGIGATATNIVALGNAVDGAKFVLRTAGASTIQAGQYNSALAGQVAQNAAANNNVWQTVVARFTNNSSRDLFANAGNKQSNTTTVTGTLTAPDRIIIGAGPNASGAKSTFFPGAVGMLAIWNVALTDDECIALNKYKANPLLVRPTSLKRYFRMMNPNDLVGTHSLTLTAAPPITSTSQAPLQMMSGRRMRK